VEKARKIDEVITKILLNKAAESEKRTAESEKRTAELQKNIKMLDALLKAL